MQENYIEAKIIDNEVAPQLKLAERVKKLVREGGEKKYYIQTFGCQQNEADSERLAGYCTMMGYTPADKPEDAKLILVNTCAVREHAEKKALSIIGQYKHIKDADPSVVIGVGGCMVTQKSRADKLKMSYPYVSFTFDTGAIHRIPELVLNALEGGKRSFVLSEEWKIDEGVPLNRSSKHMAWLSIMYGCNNFCTYCIVPYVRGRERSRSAEDILAEARQLIDGGAKDITLLGQNVNSYGKDLGIDVDFSDLLRRLNAVPGDFWLRFMTSHPKDASPKLFSTMAECGKVAKQLHLPFQSGSDEILHRMNRRYTAEHYKSLIADARSKMPDITLSSDIIVGFPGETDEDFEQTLKLVQDTRFDLLFTFLYSPRTGTPAASYEDNATPQDKQRRFERLLKAQDEIVAEKQAAYQGRKLRLLVDGNAKGPEYPFTARTEGNLLVCVRGDDIKIGEFIEAEIEKTSLRCLFAHKL